MLFGGALDCANWWHFDFKKIEVPAISTGGTPYRRALPEQARKELTETESWARKQVRLHFRILEDFRESRQLLISRPAVPSRRE
jgi:hypothetical protein